MTSSFAFLSSAVFYIIIIFTVRIFINKSNAVFVIR